MSSNTGICQSSGPETYSKRKNLEIVTKRGVARPKVANLLKLYLWCNTLLQYTWCELRHCIGFGYNYYTEEKNHDTAAFPPNTT